MNIHGIASAASAYAVPSTASSRPKPLQTLLPAQGGSTQVSLSDEALALGSTNAEDIQARLKTIKSTPRPEWTQADRDYLQVHDSRYAGILEKPFNARTAEDVDYLQKDGGSVNTMAKLSPKEKALYNELVAQGNLEAVRGMNLLALSRTGEGEVTLANGRSFDPNQTEITPENIRNLFSQMFSGDDDSDARSFEALASYLDGRKQSDASRA